MDTSASDITFDLDGRCWYCTELIQRLARSHWPSAESREAARRDLLAAVARDGRGKEYDCIVGVSGGVDSSWVLVDAVRAGLRPLAVHMDNGWDSELAQSNIASLVRGLDVDLYTYVIDWDEYRSLMLAFFDADVIDIELLYDNALAAVNFQQARAYGLHYILSGQNLATEGMLIPRQWNWLKMDRRNIEAIRRAYDGGGLKSFPAIGSLSYAWHMAVRGIRWIPYPDYLEYERSTVLNTLTSEFGYRPYRNKHYESVFTRLYMSYILPVKFDVDMRRVDYSNLIVSGQMTREEALSRLAEPAYGTDQDLAVDIEYFRKKIGWSEADWRAYLARPPVPHRAFASEFSTYHLLQWLRHRIPRRFAGH
ncbi:MAG: N-acetyl sugar amidotransferase [Actinomycetales bacterium]|nr:N-acetyl sugar amidotransferase [Actinomycetales bacterium]